MEGVAAWRRWFGPPVRDAIIVVVVTAILVSGSYGEGSPSSPSDRIQFGGHAAPQPGAALILVAIAGLALLWRRRAPVAVLAVSVVAASVYSLLGLVNGAILIAPILALYSVASQVSLRRAFIAALVTLAILLTVTAAIETASTATGARRRQIRARPATATRISAAPGCGAAWPWNWIWSEGLDGLPSP